MKKNVIVIYLIMFILVFALNFSVADNDNSNSGMDDGKIQAGTDDGAQSNASINSKKTENNTKEKIELNIEEIKKIIQDRNRLRIHVEEGESCPDKCSCEGVVVKCELENGTREMTIHAGKSGNIIVQVKGINASTNVTLYKADDGKVYAQFKNNETKEIILPDEIKDRIRERIKARLENESINLTEDGRYEIEARKRARLFGIFPVKERVRTQIDAETGEIIRTRTSWWGFLAKDVEDNSNNSEQ